ncbi:MAG: hypothetical protein JXQ73_21255 [Phycisphaerae bacterium]|nr:hypothetical protein [Phycisphaerae bacterium]
MRGIIVAAIAVTSASTAAGEPIGVFDLTYALKFDAKDADQVARAWDHCHAVATLQGIVNRDAPRLYVRFVEASGRNVDDYWLGRMSEPGRWLAGRERRTVPDISALVTEYRRFIKGVVLYDERVPATSNVASTIAGVEDLIALRYDPSPGSLYRQLCGAGPRLPVRVKFLTDTGLPIFTGKGKIPDTDIASTGSAKCDAHLWLKAHYIDTGKVDAGLAGFYLDAYWLKVPTACSANHHTLTNHDFFVAKKGWFFDLNTWADEVPVDDKTQRLGTDLDTLKAMLLSAYKQAGKDRMIHIGGFTPWAYKYTTHGGAGGKHDGVPTEWEFGKTASAYNAFVDADAIGLGAMANASFFMHFPLKERYPQPWVTHGQLKERGYLTADGKVNFAGRDFIIFYVGDYDSAAWVYQFMPGAWDHPDRGKIPLMWCISPVLDRRAPMALDYFRRTATKNDHFAAADNGAGYLNPGMLQEPRPISGLPSGLDAWARHCERYYKRWDITITGFVIDGYAPGLNEKGLDCYARFSPNGIVPQKTPPSLLHGNMPVIRADHDVNQAPDEAARVICQRVKARKLPFHWFRNILKTPDWYVAVHQKVKELNPKIELLDAPTFFELYRVYLRNHPAGAKGEVPLS